MDPPVENNGGYKKKNKRSKRSKFLANAKGFAKQGIYGRGTTLEEEDYKYFINLLDAMKTGFESTDEKEAMANNVFEQTKGKEVHFSSNQITSKAIESLIAYTDEENFQRFVDAVGKDLRPICSDKFASHVIQKTVEIAFLRIVGTVKKEEADEEPAKKKLKTAENVVFNEFDFSCHTEFSAEHKQFCAKYVVKVSKFLLNNLEDFYQDLYGNHIIRTCVDCLAGLHIPKIAFDRNFSYKNCSAFPVDEEWTEILLDYISRLEMWPQFNDLLESDLFSCLLGHLCIALRTTDKNRLKSFGKKILREGFAKSVEGDAATLSVFQQQSTAHLLEILLYVAGPKLFSEIYKTIFENRVGILAKERASNFAVQKLFENVKDVTEFEAMFADTVGTFDELLKAGHAGVIAAVSSACLRLQAKQGAFVSVVQNLFGVSGSKDKADAIFKCLLKIKEYNAMLADKTTIVNLHGSRMIQDILKFNKPILIINSILATDSAELASVFSTPNGSFIADAFIESKFVGEKSREKLIKHMEGTYLNMAINKFGSRVVDRLFAAANEGQQGRIAKELSAQLNLLNSTMFGRILFQKFRINTFKLSPAQWKEGCDRASKAEKLFKDIVA